MSTSLPHLSFPVEVPRSPIVIEEPVQPASRINLGSLGIDTYSETALVDHVLDHAFNSTKTRQIVTANAQFYVLAEKNQRFRSCLESAEYICADGMPIVWACERFTGIKVPRITGVDFIGMLCERGARDGLRVYLLGGRPGYCGQAEGVVSRRCDCWSRLPGVGL
jgi:N-acetylglucosaminyldiphosphoundecaprenol N-acetyl-beta-D-mannosaminyltransferase